MNKKQLVVVLICIISITFFIMLSKCLCAEDYCVPGYNLASTTLRLFYDSGAISGYIIFRNSKGEMCRVKFPESAILFTYDDKKGQIWKKDLGYISLDDFKILKLKNGDEILAYPINQFIFDLPKDTKVNIWFEWGGIKTNCQVNNF